MGFSKYNSQASKDLVYEIEGMSEKIYSRQKTINRLLYKRSYAIYRLKKEHNIIYGNHKSKGAKL